MVLEGRGEFRLASIAARDARFFWERSMFNAAQIDPLGVALRGGTRFSFARLFASTAASGARLFLERSRARGAGRVDKLSVGVFVCRNISERLSRRTAKQKLVK